MSGPGRRLNPDTLEEFQLLEQLQPGFCEKLLQRFEESFEQGLAALGQTEETEADILHRLSGSAASFGALELADHIRRFERRIRQGRPGPSLDDIGELRASTQQVSLDFRNWLGSRCSGTRQAP
ncbi:MAG: Hpt domain-containing protein [Wenzhouxiangella sp.]